ncbi:MAG: M42 family metallopeptidase [Anaerolineae bacterium]|nr:M42 family metallopeptidase [Anaerolineae bacterium]
MKSLVKNLVETAAPSGFEKPIRDLILAEIGVSSTDQQIDALGNLIIRKGTRTPTGKRIMLAAHMDEIGVMASFIDEKGFIRFTNLGGVFPVHCVGSRVKFLNGVEGVIGMDKLDKPGLPTLSQLFIDVGAASRAACPIKIGDAAVFERPFAVLGEQWVAKSLDDRIGVAILIETFKQLKETPHEVYFVFSVQEEVGTRGATTAAYGIDPDLGLSVDVTRTGDTPKGIMMEVALGKGPAIKVRDSGMISDPQLVQALSAIAEKSSIPYQLEVLEAGTTDARAIQLARSGVPSGCVSIPCRYVHSPSEMVNEKDVYNTVNLLVKFLSESLPF